MSPGLPVVPECPSAAAGRSIKNGSINENESDCSYLVPESREGVEVRIELGDFAIGDGCDYGDCGTAAEPLRLRRRPLRLPAVLPTLLSADVRLDGAWWGINTDVQDQFVDGPLTANFRYYGMINYAELESVIPGAGYPEHRDEFLQLRPGHRPRCQTRVLPSACGPTSPHRTSS